MALFKGKLMERRNGREHRQWKTRGTPWQPGESKGLKYIKNIRIDNLDVNVPEQWF